MVARFQPVQQTSQRLEPFVSKRGRPSVRQTAAINQLILQTACATFLNKGFADTSMEAVAAAAGVSKGTLYGRYSSKQELFEAVARDRIASWRLLTRRDPLPDDMPVPARLMHRGSALLRMLRMPEISAFMRLLDSEATRFPALVKSFSDEGTQAILKIVTDDIKQLNKGLDIPLVDPQGVADTFLSSIFGWYYLNRTADEITDDLCAAFLSRLIGLLIGGRAAW